MVLKYVKFWIQISKPYKCFLNENHQNLKGFEFEKFVKLICNQKNNFNPKSSNLI